MIVNIHPSIISGGITAPASKSSMQRACAAALVRKGKSRIFNPGRSNDDKAALNIIQVLGAEVKQIDDESIEIISNGINLRENIVNCGESGLSIRMFTPLAALNVQPVTISGEGSLKSRPMDFFDAVMPLLNVKVNSNNGKLPLLLEGPLKPVDITIDGSLSSQFLTGLLFAYSAADAKNVSIRVNDLKSKPYIDLTLDVMKSFGLKIPENNNYESFYYSAEQQPVTSSAVEYTVEGDWSNAAFLLTGGGVSGKIIVRELDIQSTQADKAILQALKDSGVQLSINQNSVEASLPVDKQLKAFEFDATDCPDLFPPLTVLAACCEGRSLIKGIHRLTHKESNRSLTLMEEFGKLGITIELQDDYMLVTGSSDIKGATVSSRNDHRIAMACAITALRADNTVTIEHPEAVNKSYPHFFTDIAKLGASVIVEK